MKLLSPKSKKWIAGIALAILGIAIAFGIAYAIKSRSNPTIDQPKVQKLVQTFVESFNTKDFDAFCSCYTPNDQKLLREAAEKIGGGDAFFQQNYANTFNDKSNQDFGDNVTLSITNLSADQEEIVDGVYNGQDMDALDVTEVYTVTGTLTTKGSLSQTSEDVVFVCVKIKGEWYIMNMYALPKADTATHA